MKTKPLLSICLLTLALASYSQESPFTSFYIDAGADFINCLAPGDKDYIRADMVMPAWYFEEPGSYMKALFYKSYFGIKYERRLVKNKLGLLSGLRYTNTNASIGKDTYWSPGSDYLYFLYSREGTTTEFLKVKDITQASHYLGIPLELRVYPYRERKVQVYYKVGFDFNVLLTSKTNVRFFDPGMDSYAKGVGRIVEDPWKVYASAHAAVGLKIGPSGKPGVNLEACFPSAIISNNSSSFVTPDFGGGIQVNIRIPF